MVYHLGTVAFGSLIIAIIKTIRAVLAYIQRQVRLVLNMLTTAVILRHTALALVWLIRIH